MVKKSKYISSAWQFNLRSHCLEEQSCKSPLFEKVPRAAGKVSKVKLPVRGSNPGSHAGLQKGHAQGGAFFLKPIFSPATLPILWQ
jgi:hypothetical protein